MLPCRLAYTILMHYVGCTHYGLQATMVLWRICTDPQWQLELYSRWSLNGILCCL